MLEAVTVSDTATHVLLALILVVLLIISFQVTALQSLRKELRERAEKRR
jgi:hypothetical protein